VAPFGLGGMTYPETQEEWREYLGRRGHHEEIRQIDLIRLEREAATRSHLLRDPTDQLRDLDYDKFDGLVTDLVMSSIEWAHKPEDRERMLECRAVIRRLARLAGMF